MKSGKGKRRQSSSSSRSRSRSSSGSRDRRRRSRDPKRKMHKKSSRRRSSSSSSSSRSPPKRTSTSNIVYPPASMLPQIQSKLQQQTKFTFEPSPAPTAHPQTSSQNLTPIQTPVIPSYSSSQAATPKMPLPTTIPQVPQYQSVYQPGASMAPPQQTLPLQQTLSQQSLPPQTLTPQSSQAMPQTQPAMPAQQAPPQYQPPSSLYSGYPQATNTAPTNQMMGPQLTYTQQYGAPNYISSAAPLPYRTQPAVNLPMFTPEGIPIQRIPVHQQRNYKYAMKLYVGNLPDQLNVEDLTYFLYKTLQKTGGIMQPGNPIITWRHNQQKKFIFLTLRSIQETSLCHQLDGIFYRGKTLRIKRPADYEQNSKLKVVEGARKLPVMDLSTVRINRLPCSVENGIEKLFYGNFPLDVHEETIIDILSSIGPLKSFQLMNDKATNTSRGFGFCQYVNEACTDECIKRINGMVVGNNNIVVKRAMMMSSHQLSTGIVGTGTSTQYLSKFEDQVLAIEKPTVLPAGAPNLMGNPDDIQGNYAVIDVEGIFKDMKVSCVVHLKNVVSPGTDPEFVKKDIASEMERIAKIARIEQRNGSIWVQYEKVEYAQIAYLVLMNHKYDGKRLDLGFYDAVCFQDGVYF